MQIKKYEAQSIQEALEHIKRDLGPEAIILQTKQNKKGFGLLSKSSVEVTAAISEKSLHKKSYVEQRLPHGTRETIQKLPADQQSSLYDQYLEKHKNKEKQNEAKKSITAVRYVDIGTPEQVKTTQQQTQQPKPNAMSLEEELKHLKSMINEMKSEQNQSASATGAQDLLKKSEFMTVALQDAFDHLIVNGVDKRISLALVKKASQLLDEASAQDYDLVMDQIAQEIMEKSEVMSLLDFESKPQIIAFVGPTGVGKTTTLAKVAGDAVLKKNLRVALINIDYYKIGASDQLSTYSKILNVPFRSVVNADELRTALQDFTQYDLILLDTSGKSQRDSESLLEIQQLLSSVSQMRTQLVLSATTRDIELFDMAKKFSIFKPESLILSKLDEAMMYGALFNISQKIKLPISYFTIGQKVPEDLEEATRERIAALVMDL